MQKSQKGIKKQPTLKKNIQISPNPVRGSVNLTKLFKYFSILIFKTVN